jgi:hypothetical protein
MVGDEASKLRSMLEVNYPMENGIVKSVFCKIYKSKVKIKSLSISETGQTCVMYGITLLGLVK